MPRLPLSDYKLFFFDSETGGLDASMADMVQVAAVLTDPTGSEVLEEYNAKVFPKKPVDPRAAGINGYSPEKWAAEAIDLDSAMVKLLGMARDAIFVAHNAPFDWAFFSTAMAQRRQRWPSTFYRIDTMALAFPLLRFRRVQDLKLTTLVNHFGFEQAEAHTALSDAKDCRRVYLELMDRYAAAFAQ